MTGFPSITSYQQARAHYANVDAWNSQYNPDYEKPIGARQVKLSHCGRRFNKAMRKRDEDIVFRLFDQDCVIWHANGELTVHGYGSMSTTAFIDALVPSNVIHLQGRKDMDEPVLQLRSCERPETGDLPWDEAKPLLQAYWRSGVIVRAERPIRLREEGGGWVPVDGWDSLDPFYVPRVDRKAAREVSKKYNLPTLEQVVRAVIALGASPPPPRDGEGSMSQIMRLLEEGNVPGAIDIMPRGTVKSFGRRLGTPYGVLPGFLTKLRNHIYDHEGVIDRVEERVLSVSGYRKMIADLNRFY